MTRGERNKNPLNIRLNKTYIWQGQVRNPKEKVFVTFNSMQNGFRAAFKTIRTYIEKHGCTTIIAIVNRWAPPTENDTQNYIQVVSCMSGMEPDAVIDFNNENQMIRLVDAMAFMENGIFFNKDVMLQAYRAVVNA